LPAVYGQEAGFGVRYARLGQQFGHDVVLQVRPAQAFIGTVDQEDPWPQSENLRGELPEEGLSASEGRNQAVSASIRL
jgi:hypothetical protein